MIMNDILCTVVGMKKFFWVHSKVELQNSGKTMELWLIPRHAGLHGVERAGKKITRRRKRNDTRSLLKYKSKDHPGNKWKMEQRVD